MSKILYLKARKKLGKLRNLFYAKILNKPRIKFIDVKNTIGDKKSEEYLKTFR